jgi:hypothetical protein
MVRFTFAGFLSLRAVDEYGALQFGEQAEQRPACDFALGDEDHRQHRTQHHDVEPGRMIGNQEERPLGRRQSAHLHAQAQHPG